MMYTYLCSRDEAQDSVSLKGTAEAGWHTFKNSMKSAHAAWRANRVAEFMKLSLQADYVAFIYVVGEELCLSFPNEPYPKQDEEIRRRELEDTYLDRALKAVRIVLGERVRPEDMGKMHMQNIFRR